MDNKKLIKTFEEFTKKWNSDKMKKLTLENYTNNDNNSFIYDVEFKTDKLGSIRGGSAFKFGIYSRKDRTNKETETGKKYNDDYAWLSKYGETQSEAFENVKKEINELISLSSKNKLANNLDWTKDIELGKGAYKWKLLFLYQNIKTISIIPIFKAGMLSDYLRSQKVYHEGRELEISDLQTIIVNKYKIKTLGQARKKAKEIWERLKEPIYTEEDHKQLSQASKDVFEGDIQERKVLLYTRNQTIVEQCKNRDNYTCRVCSFFYDNKIVEAHHLQEVSKAGKVKITKDDLITLCPTCHRIAHLIIAEEKINYQNPDIIIDAVKKALE